MHTSTGKSQLSAAGSIYAMAQASWKWHSITTASTETRMPFHTNRPRCVALWLSRVRANPRWACASHVLSSSVPACTSSARTGLSAWNSDLGMRGEAHAILGCPDVSSALLLRGAGDAGPPSPTWTHPRKHGSWMGNRVS